jgi:muscarinic acetylcholine receptor
MLLLGRIFQVLIMVAGTWIFPAAVFFTTIIGWQYFVEVGRTVGELECYVQFMNNPLFTFCLTIGYYWITLIVMCILYAGIYKVRAMMKMMKFKS